MTNKKVKNFINPMKLFIEPVFLILLTFYAENVFAADWPMYKGNLYFSSNNDEIPANGNDVKWIFRGQSRMLNPIVSDNLVYSIDLKKNIYALDKESGAVIWMKNLLTIGGEFKFGSKLSGKVKYPLVYGEYLILSDATAIFCLNKNNGEVIWARTALVDQDYGKAGTPVRIDGIYADPLIDHSRIYYGTRNFFAARDLATGNLIWANKDVKTYSGFPSVYDKYILTQSVDYSNKIYYLYCLDSATGTTVWKREVPVSIQIFSPVVYKGKIFMPSADSVYIYNLESGDTIDKIITGGVITSHPSFSDREIRIILNNHILASYDSEDYHFLYSIDLPEKSSPVLAAVRDQIYLAYSQERGKLKDKINGRYIILDAIESENQKVLWSFKSNFPGGTSEIALENGILYLPSGDLLYALGQKGSDIEQHWEDIIKKDKNENTEFNQSSPENQRSDDSKETDSPDKKEKGFHEIELNITAEEQSSEENNSVVLDIIQVVDDKLVYHKKEILSNGKGKISIPDGEGVQIIASDTTHMPEKVFINEETRDVSIQLQEMIKEQVIKMDSIVFELNKYYLKKESIPILEQVVRVMKSQSDLKLEIKGHTDSTGGSEYNKKLSRKRADSVADFLVKNGISPERVTSEGYGFDFPVADNSTESGRSKNRRTEFVFH